MKWTSFATYIGLAVIAASAFGEDGSKLDTARPTARWVQAIMMVESSGNPDAHNEDEKARGILQIRPIMVRDVNRILELQGKDKRYTHDDAWYPDASFEMFYIYSYHYLPNGTAQMWARNWNGGPTGNDKGSTKPYWERVKRAYLRLEAT